MKKLFLIACLVAFTYTASAQIEAPQPSPFSKIEQKVGLTDVTLEFSRPGVKGRTVFGDLVPFGKVWRTGANANTKITFSTNVTVNGQTLKAGLRRSGKVTASVRPTASRTRRPDQANQSIAGTSALVFHATKL